MKRVDLGEFCRRAEERRRPFHAGYYAMYSSVYGGITTDPLLMLVPVDDHLVHRGDGVFETFKAVAGSIYNLQAHLERLVQSAAAMELRVPVPAAALAGIVVETVRCGGHRDCAIRVLASRGPGSFGVNPYDCPEPQLYVIVTRLEPPFMDRHPDGARVKTSSIPAKPAYLAAVKSCNYLPNVLMKKEAVTAGVDFVVAFDARGCMTEGATENMGIVTRQRRLLFPRLEGILAGTTMLRVLQLAQALVGSGELAEAALADISRPDVLDAEEFLIVGTTPNVSAAVEFDGAPVGAGRPGPVYARLSRLLLDDMRSNEALQTRVFPREGRAAEG